MLTDYLVADPRVVRELHDAGVPHLPVRVRDGTGLVGPLVIPGVTSCLRCADLHRSDRDAAWPAVAAQLCQTVGTADRATVLATAALALNEVDHVIRAVRSDGGSARPRPSLPRRRSTPPWNSTSPPARSRPADGRGTPTAPADNDRFQLVGRSAAQSWMMES